MTFSRGLVFESPALAPCGDNPLTLGRTKLYPVQNDPSGTSLPAIPVLETGRIDPPDLDVLRAVPIAERLPALVSLLAEARPTHRPLVLCVADWKDGPCLVEALLTLLPPSARRRTTFATFETDLSWFPADRIEGAEAARHILVICGPEDTTSNLTPYDYESRLAIFNMVRGEFSEVSDPGPFALLAAAAVASRKPDRLAEHHGLAEDLKLDRDVTDWDTLVTVLGITDLESGVDEIFTRLSALVSLVARSEQVRPAVDLMLPHLRRLASANDRSRLGTYRDLLNTVLARADAAVRADVQVGIGDVIRPLVTSRLAEGRARTLAALLEVAGAEVGPRLLREGLLGRLPSPTEKLPSGAEKGDRMVLVDLLQTAALETETTADLFALAAIRAAIPVGRTLDVWNAVSETVYKPRLDGEWDESKGVLLRVLLETLTAEICPEACVWLLRRQLELRDISGEARLDALLGLADAASRIEASPVLRNAILTRAREISTTPARQATTLARLAGAARGKPGGEIRDALRVAYRAIVADLTDDEIAGVYNQVARTGVTHFLTGEMIHVLEGQDQKAREATLAGWKKTLFAAYPQVRDDLLACLGSRVASGPDVVWKVAWLLLRLQIGAEDNGHVVLFDAVIRALPMEPVAKEWKTILEALPERLSKDSRSRAEVLGLMRRVEELGSTPDRSIVTFLYNDPAWREVKNLTDKARAETLAWCTDQLKGGGVSTPQEAERLVQLLGAGGLVSARYTVEVAAAMMQGRPALTRCLLTIGFVDCYLEGTSVEGRWLETIKGIVNELDRSERRLLVGHLKDGFARPGPGRAIRRARLHDVLDIKAPRARKVRVQEPPPVPETSHARPASDPRARTTAESRSPEPQPEGSSIGRMFGRLFTRSSTRKGAEPERRPAETRKAAKESTRTEPGKKSARERPDATGNDPAKES